MASITNLENSLCTHSISYLENEQSPKIIHIAHVDGKLQQDAFNKTSSGFAIQSPVHGEGHLKMKHQIPFPQQTLGE